MKKIVNGKVYDTGKAKYVGEYRNGLGENDPHMIAETLYQKRTGEFFLYGRGGAMTQYSRYAGSNEWGCGEKIMPLTYGAAKEWGKEHMGETEYNSHFITTPKGEEKSQICVSISKSTLASVKRKAMMEGITVSKYFENAARAAVEAQENEGR